jgi:hypothetical protein
MGVNKAMKKHKPSHEDELAKAIDRAIVDISDAKKKHDQTLEDAQSLSYPPCNLNQFKRQILFL